MLIEATAILLTDGAASAWIRFEDGRLVIRMDGGGVLVTSDTVTVEAEALARVDGGARVELHADAVTRVDAGGVGFTYMPDAWHHFYPWAGGSWRPAPPEHPDVDAMPYGPFGWDYEQLLAEYWDLFPTPDPVMPEGEDL